MLKAVLPQTSADFARAIIMPNLVPPVVSCRDASAYRERIMAALPGDHDFEPLMTLYLTETTDPDDVEQGARSGLVKALKLYPAGATTNSESGVRSIEAIYPVLEKMSEIDLPLCVHGEVTDPEIDIFDREAVFIERVLSPIRERFPDLRIVMEHLTTEDGVQFVKGAGHRTSATITTHHLIINRNAILVGGIKPHYYCLPVAKREKHRLALREAATSGDGKFFLGTDSAPHLASAKESPCGCAGIFSASNTLSCLAHVFEQDGALDQFEAFVSLNGPSFYGLPLNEDRVRFFKGADPVEFPGEIAVGEDSVVLFDPGFPLYWRHEAVTD
ncbi:dihydroorotase [uncultured Cohaesibacter sp.]|uniref:dihydroorotase n=1 Tax=uncultured Cohaesibacter sp. TaxID=1002546 RepID=UPI003749861F